MIFLILLNFNHPPHRFSESHFRFLQLCARIFRRNRRRSAKTSRGLRTDLSGDPWWSREGEVPESPPVPLPAFPQQFNGSPPLTAAKTSLIINLIGLFLAASDEDVLFSNNTCLARRRGQVNTARLLLSSRLNLNKGTLRGWALTRPFIHQSSGKWKQIACLRIH